MPHQGAQQSRAELTRRCVARPDGCGEALVYAREERWRVSSPLLRGCGPNTAKYAHPLLATWLAAITGVVCT